MGNIKIICILCDYSFMRPNEHKETLYCAHCMSIFIETLRYAIGLDPIPNSKHRQKGITNVSTKKCTAKP